MRHVRIWSIAIGGLLTFLLSQAVVAAERSTDGAAYTLADSGAIGDGITDASAAINAYLARLPAPGLVRVPADALYLIASSDLIVPPGVMLQGQASAQLPTDAITLKETSGFLLNPGHTIRLAQGSQLRDLVIRRAGLVPNPTAEQVMAAVARWGADRSVGVTVPRNTGGTKLIDLFVEGFNICVKAQAGNFSIERLVGDCYNGIDISFAGDNHYIDDVRFEPYYALHTRFETGSWARPGIAFNLHDGNTGTFITRGFSFMYASGVVLNDVGVTQIANSGFEWQRGGGGGIVGTKGVRWINHNSETSTNDVYVNGFDVAMSDEGTGEVMMVATSAPASHVATTFNLAGPPGRSDRIGFAGKASSQGTNALALSSEELGERPVDLVYATAPNETGAVLASEFSRLINANQRLIAAGVFSKVEGNAVTIYPPKGIDLRVVARNADGLSSTEEQGPASAGSYGSIIGADTAGADGVHPIYTFGPGVFSWQVQSPFIGDNILPRNWIKVAPESLGRVQLIGVRWSALPGVTACGEGNPTVTPTATDASGTITGARSATGCQLVFRTPWPWVPECIVTSPTGSPITRYVVSTTALTIVHPMGSGDRFSYKCSP